MFRKVAKSGTVRNASRRSCSSAPPPSSAAVVNISVLVPFSIRRKQLPLSSKSVALQPANRDPESPAATAIRAASPPVTFAAVASVATYVTDSELVPSLSVTVNLSPTSTLTGRRRHGALLAVKDWLPSTPPFPVAVVNVQRSSISSVRLVPSCDAARPLYHSPAAIPVIASYSPATTAATVPVPAPVVKEKSCVSLPLPIVTVNESPASTFAGLKTHVRNSTCSSAPPPSVADKATVNVLSTSSVKNGTPPSDTVTWPNRPVGLLVFSELIAAASPAVTFSAVASVATYSTDSVPLSVTAKRSPTSTNCGTNCHRAFADNV